jgi:hypothetical protein
VKPIFSNVKAEVTSQTSCAPSLLLDDDEGGNGDCLLSLLLLSVCRDFELASGRSSWEGRRISGLASTLSDGI